MTKEQLIATWHKYRHMTKRLSIYDVYKKPSDYKIKAYNHCLQFMHDKDGWNGTIIWYNCQRFTYGFVSVEGFYYMTVDNTYFIPIKDLPITEAEQC